jgi:hypothetical protein
MIATYFGGKEGMLSPSTKKLWTSRVFGIYYVPPSTFNRKWQLSFLALPQFFAVCRRPDFLRHSYPALANMQHENVSLQVPNTV